MNYLPLIIAVVVGIAIGAYFGYRKSVSSAPRNDKREGNKKKILNFLKENKKATNDDLEKLLGVSDATVTRYMDQLEKQGKIRQIGTTGRYVYYVLK